MPPAKDKRFVPGTGPPAGPAETAAGIWTAFGVVFVPNSPAAERESTLDAKSSLKGSDGADATATGAVPDSVPTSEVLPLKKRAAVPSAKPADQGRSRMVVVDDEADAPLRKSGPGRVTPPAASARLKGRHWGVVLSFLLLVVAPTLLAGWYLWTRAQDRYVSTAGFSVRTEGTLSAYDMLGGLAAVGGGSGNNDNDILFDFIQSQQIVAALDARVDLRAMWSRADPAVDPVFAYHPPGTIEDMVDYWNRMVFVYNDSSTGLMTLRVQAFTPQDALTVAQLITEESATIINRLSDQARADATRHSREELEIAEERLRDAREAVTRFRNTNQIVDPKADIASQMGLLSQLEAELASTLIDLDLLRQTTSESDPRTEQAERRVKVIEERIVAERAKLGIGAQAGSDSDRGFADIVGEYERLFADQLFAEEAYAAARAAYDISVAESRRNSRYLAIHVAPTLPERANEPQRAMIVALIGLFSGLLWAMLVLAAYALRDRR